MKQKNDNRFWNSFARKYDKFISKYANETYKRSLELMVKELSEDSKVLEIGTGTGLISFSIADKVKSIIAIDYAPEMIEVAKEKQLNTSFDNIEFKVSGANSIKYPDSSFTVAVASNVFHLIPEPHKVLGELHRLIPKNGKLILPTYCHGQSLKTRIISAVMGISGFKAVNRWSVKQYKTFIESGDFLIEKEIIIEDKIPMSFIVATKK